MNIFTARGCMIINWIIHEDATFVFLYKIRKGLIDVKEDEIMELMKRRGGRNVEQKYSEYIEIDRMMFYKGIRDYVLFGCNKWENLELQGFKFKLKKEYVE